MAYKTKWSIIDYPLSFQFVLLGAVPFPKDVPRLKQLGVGGVITLNEPYETLVSTSLYHVIDIFPSLFPLFAYLVVSFCVSAVDIACLTDAVILPW